MKTFKQFLQETTIVNDLQNTAKGEERVPVHGKPFEFHFFRHNKSAGNYGSVFGQNIEPHGRYMTQINPLNYNKALVLDFPHEYESGKINFKRPYVLEFGGGYGADTNWKITLSKQFNGKKSKRLSQAIVDAGYDGVVTYSKSTGPNRPAHTDEIVDLTSFTPNIQQSVQETKPQTKPMELHHENI